MKDLIKAVLYGIIIGMVFIIIIYLTVPIKERFEKLNKEKCKHIKKECYDNKKDIKKKECNFNVK